MSLNRPDLIKRFIGVASNAIMHITIINTELDENTKKYYAKEVKRDSDIALNYRNKINPINALLPQKDVEEIRTKIILKVKAELLKRVDKGYNVNISLVEKVVDEFLKKNKIS